MLLAFWRESLVAAAAATALEIHVFLQKKGKNIHLQLFLIEYQ